MFHSRALFARARTLAASMDAEPWRFRSRGGCPRRQISHRVGIDVIATWPTRGVKGLVERGFAAQARWPNGGEAGQRGPGPGSDGQQARPVVSLWTAGTVSHPGLYTS